MNEKPGFDPHTADRGRLLMAFVAVYLVWGSTYLAIRIAVESIPPLMLMGVRSALAGGLLYAFARLRLGVRPEARHWRSSLLVGSLFFLGCHGALAWAETRMPSGAAALVIATMPIWMVVLGGREIGNPLRLAFAMILGIAGVGLLAGPSSLLGGGAVDPGAALILVMAALSWATGSVVSKRIPRPSSNILATGMDLLCGSSLLCAASVLRGEPAAVGPAALSWAPLGALAYLVVFGSVVALSAYTWLLRNTTLPRASSYVYVNPVVALVIGWVLGGETITPRVAGAAAVLILSVVLIMAAPAAPPRLSQVREDLDPASSRP